MSWGCFDSKVVLYFLGGTGAVGCGYHWWYTQSSSTYPIAPSLTSSFDSSRAVLHEEYQRYPCRALQGWDVVVRNYYVPMDLDNKRAYGTLLGLHGVWNRTVSSFKLLFAEDQDKRLGNGSAYSLSSSSSSVRVVDDEKAGRASSCTWPEGTQKYSSLVLEPSRQSNSTPFGEEQYSTSRKREQRSYSPTSILRSLVDTATDQTVIRCDPFAPCTTTTKRRRGEGVENEVTVSIPNCANRGTSLEVPYLRTMLSSLAWLPLHPPPLHVGILGVGGGAMSAFLLRYAGKAIHRMDLVDVEPMCFASALNDLGLSTTLKEEDVVIMEGSANHEDSSSHLSMLGKYRADIPFSALRSGRWESGVHLYSMDAAEFLRQAAGGAMQRVSSPTVDASRTSGCTGLPLAPCGSEIPLGTSLHCDSASRAMNEKGIKKERKGWRFFRRPTQSPLHAAHGTIPTFTDDIGNVQGGATTGSLQTKDQLSFTAIPTPTVPTTPSFSKALFDVLMVDLYVGSLFSEQQVHPTFLNLCRANLSSNGVVAFNVPHRLPEFEELCKGVFGKDHVYAISVPSAANYVVIASNGRDGALSNRLRYRRAKEVTKWLKLPYPLEKELPAWWSFW